MTGLPERERQSILEEHLDLCEENERLRTALEKINASYAVHADAIRMRDIARKALSSDC